MSAPGGAGSGAPTAVVVGAGISGVACAQALRAGGVDVRVLDRGRRPGGRLGARTLHLAGGDHLVDTGAAYFTVRDEAFAAVVAAWSEAGLARPWTGVFDVLDLDGTREAKPGPQRWAAPGGLRGLVDDLAEGLDLAPSTTVRCVGVVDGRPAVDGAPADAVVLAMPDPQAGRLLDADASPGLADARRVLSRPWEAVVTVYAGWDERWWEPLTGGFVSGDDELLTLVADDGDRRGDGAAVLVAHTTDAAAKEHLGDPDALIEPVLARLGDLLGRSPVPPPREAAVQRWSFAQPGETHDEPYLLTSVGSGSLGVCGDAWGDKPRVEQAWRSGRDLGRALAERLAA